MGRQQSEDLWIFAYGSLMWRPGFAYEEAARARLNGFHRSFCLYSTHHRGSESRPGLVLGLDQGQVCEGVAYRIAGSTADAIVAYLRQRELISGVYREVFVPATLETPERRTVRALAFVVERAHPSYAARLPLATQANLIRGAAGRSGTNLDYLVNTTRHLADLGIREPSLERLLNLAGQLVAHTPGAPHESPRAAAHLRAWRTKPFKVRRMRPAERRRFLYRVRLSSAQTPPVQSCTVLKDEHGIETGS